jgi:uncharacterized protein (DUF952 family)
LVAFGRSTCHLVGVSEGAYRICAATDWATTTTTGQLPLSPADQRDGFVHMSTASQVAGTLKRFYAGREDLVLLSICVDRLGDGEVRYEAASNGELFPHFYGQIGIDAIIEATPLSLDEHGEHRLPAPLLEAIASASE